MRVYTYKMKMDRTTRMPEMVRESARTFPEIRKIAEPGDVVQIMMDVFGAETLPEEYVWVVCMDQKGRVIGVSEVSHGTACVSPVSPREVFMRAVNIGAVQIVLVHNHPSGDPEPSKEDDETTKRLLEAGKLLSVRLTDHIIIGDGTYYSYVRSGKLNA